MRYLRYALLGLLALVALLAAGSNTARADHGTNRIQTVGLDFDISGNATDSIGAIDNCVEVASGGSTQFDLVIAGIPSGFSAIDVIEMHIYYDDSSMRIVVPTDVQFGASVVLIDIGGGGEPAGETSLLVNSSAGFAPGDLIVIDPGGGSEEVRTVASIPDSTHIDITGDPLVNSQATFNQVKKLLMMMTGSAPSLSNNSDPVPDSGAGLHDPGEFIVSVFDASSGTNATEGIVARLTVEATGPGGSPNTPAGLYQFTLGAAFGDVPDLFDGGGNPVEYEMYVKHNLDTVGIEPTGIRNGFIAVDTSCSSDSDLDGVENVADNCPTEYNPATMPDCDGAVKAKASSAFPDRPGPPSQSCRSDRIARL